MVLKAETALEIDNNIYFFCDELNLLFHVEKSSNNVIIDGSIPGISFFENQICRRMLLYKDMILLAPYNMSDLWMYNLKNNEWKKIHIEPDNYNSDKWLFFEMILIDDNIFLMGGKYSSIVKVNMKDLHIEYYRDVLACLDKKVEQLNDVYFRGVSAHLGDDYYMASAVDNTILRINLRTMMYEWITIDVDVSGFAGIVWDGSCFWLSPRKKGPIIRWDGDSNFEIFELTKEYFEQERFYFSGIYYYNNQIIAPAMDLGKTVIIDNSSLNITYDKEYYKFACCNAGDYLKMNVDGKITFYESNDKYEFYCNINQNAYAEYLHKHGIALELNESIIKESEFKSLRLFIDSIIHK